MWQKWLGGKTESTVKRTLKNQWIVWVGTEWTNRTEYDKRMGRIKITLTLLNFSLDIGLGQIRPWWGFIDGPPGVVKK